MQRQNYLNWALYVIVMALAMWWLGAGKPMKMQGLFIASGLAVGSLYALGGIGMVVLYRATGVLNFSYGTPVDLLVCIIGGAVILFILKCLQE